MYFMLRKDISELLRLIIALVFSEQLYCFYCANLLPFSLFPATEWGRNLLGNDLVFEYLNCLLSGPIDRTFCSTYYVQLFVLHLLTTCLFYPTNLHSNLCLSQ